METEFSQLSILGSFHLQINGVEVKLSSRKTQALLVYLACHPDKPVRRATIASLLWCDSNDKLARNNLRQALSQLRKSIRQSLAEPVAVIADGCSEGNSDADSDDETQAISGFEQAPAGEHEFLIATPETLQLVSNKLATDVAALRQLAENKPALSDAEDQYPDKATLDQLFRGDLFDEVDLGEALFDEWLVTERQSLSSLYESLLQRWVEAYESAGQTDRCIDTAKQLLARNPLDENVHRSLMRAYGQRGRRNELARQYRDCTDVLHKELGVSPSEETTKLYSRLLQAPPPETETITAKITSPVTPESEYEERGSPDSRTKPPTTQSGNNDSSRVQKPRQQARAFLDMLQYTPAMRLLLVALLGVTPILGLQMFKWKSTADNEVRLPQTQEVASDDFKGSKEAGNMESVASDTTQQSQNPPLAIAPDIAIPRDLNPGVQNLDIAIPSIAILPFKNIGEDPEQRYFSLGLTEDLITELARFESLIVIAPHSSFSFENSSLEPAEIANKLGVRYLLQGSVRKSDSDIRINSSLVDAESGSTIWSDRYDRSFAGIFALQDELTQTIAREMSVNLSTEEQGRFNRLMSVDPDAYDLVLRGLEPLRHFTAEGLVEARYWFRRALELDPNYARAHANIALTHGTAIVFRLTESPETEIELGLKHIDKAESIAPNIPQIQFAKAVIQLAAQEFDSAVAAARQSIKLEPSYADGYAVLAQTLCYSGKLAEALAAIDAGIRLSPVTPFSYLWVKAHIHYLNRNFDAALPILEEVVTRNPSFVQGHLLIAATYARLGLQDDALWHQAEVLTLVPDFSTAREISVSPYRTQAHRQLFADGLQMAGLPP